MVNAFPTQSRISKHVRQSSFVDRLESPLFTLFVSFCAVRLAPESFPWMSVVRRGSDWITLNNRRLYVFRCARVGEINCIDCTSLEAAQAELTTNFFKVAGKRHDIVEENVSDRTLSDRELESSQLTQRWIDFIVQLNPLGAPLASGTLNAQIPVEFSQWEEYHSVLLDFLRHEAALKLFQAAIRARAISRSDGDSGSSERYPREKVQAQVVRHQPRASRDNFKADIIVIRFQPGVRPSSQLRPLDCVVLVWKGLKEPLAQYGVVTFITDETSEVQVKLAISAATADFVDRRLVMKEQIFVDLQAIDNVSTQSRVATALQHSGRNPLFESLLHFRQLRIRQINHESLGDLESWAESQMNFNPAQLTAISAIAHDKNSLLLIQGPPGTGKTATILGALASLIYQGKRVLVVSPSNHAIANVRTASLLEPRPFTQ